MLKSEISLKPRLNVITLNGHRISVTGSSKRSSTISTLAIRREQTFAAVDEILDNLGLSNSYILSIVLCMNLCWALNIMNIMRAVFYGSGLLCDTNDQECNEEAWKMLTIKDRFHIHQESRVSIEWTMTVFFIGDLFGGAFISILSNRIGRRSTLFPSMLLMSLFGILSTYAQSYETFLMVRFCEGFFLSASLILCWTYVFECVSIKRRALVLLIFGLFWTTGYCLIAILSEFVPDWRDVTMILCISTAILTTILWVIIPESFHFLVEHSRINAVKKWLHRANKHSFEVALLTRVIDEDEESKNDFRIFITFMNDNPIYILYLIASCFVWFTNFAIYIGMIVYSVNLGGYSIENYIFSGLVELPAFLLCSLLLDGLGRKPTFIIIHLINLCCFAFLSISNHSNRLLFIAIWMLAKFSSASSFSYMFVYGSEPFPVIIRNMTMTFCVIFSTLGTVFGSQLHLLSTVDVFWIVLASLSSISLLCFIVLPETKPTKGSRHTTLYNSIDH